MLLLLTHQVAPALVRAYPLDDDGTLAAGYGYQFAGPAVGADQRVMDWTSSASGIGLLAPADPLVSGRFARPAAGRSVVEAVYLGTGATWALLSSTLTDAGGTPVAGATVVHAGPAPGDVLAITVDADGSMRGWVNSLEVALSWTPGNTAVPAGGGWSASMGALVGSAGVNVDMALRVLAEEMTGSYGAGQHDPWEVAF